MRDVVPRRRRFGRLGPVAVAVALVAGVLIPVAPAAAATTTVVAFGASDWRYYRATAAPPSGWRTVLQPWKKGAAPLGFGHSTGQLRTKLPNLMKTRPLATYFQRSFTLSQVPAGGLKVTTWADDGVVLYVNGTEVLRSNVDRGTPKHDRYWASNAPQSSRARTKLITATIPASALKAGKNMLAAQVQSNWRATHNVTFDAKLTFAAPAAEPTPTVPPNPAPAPPASPAPKPGFVASPSHAAKWGEPTWRDEFTYVDPVTGKPAVDPANWNVRSRSEMGLFSDAAMVDPGQVDVDSSGVLHLRGDWMDTPISRPHASWPDLVTHKTGYIDQRLKHPGDVTRTQRWGRWEMRAQVPTGPRSYGALAAFWLRNSKSGEIDIMEAWGYNEAPMRNQKIGSSMFSIHNDTMHVNPKKLEQRHQVGGAPNEVWRGFHTYAFELMPTYAAVYVDEVRVQYLTPETYPDLWNQDYFGSPFHMRINLHIGTSAAYWGIPDPVHKEWTQSLDYKVDYVRTWEYVPAR
jgi:hypothetical protein